MAGPSSDGLAGGHACSPAGVINHLDNHLNDQERRVALPVELDGIDCPPLNRGFGAQWGVVGGLEGRESRAQRGLESDIRVVTFAIHSAGVVRHGFLGNRQSDGLAALGWAGLIGPKFPGGEQDVVALA